LRTDDFNKTEKGTKPFLCKDVFIVFIKLDIIVQIELVFKRNSKTGLLRAVAD